MNQRIPEIFRRHILSKKSMWTPYTAGMNMIQNYIPCDRSDPGESASLIHSPTSAPPQELDEDRNWFIHSSFLISPHKIIHTV